MGRIAGESNAVSVWCIYVDPTIFVHILDDSLHLHLIPLLFRVLFTVLPDEIRGYERSSSKRPYQEESTPSSPLFLGSQGILRALFEQQRRKFHKEEQASGKK